MPTVWGRGLLRQKLTTRRKINRAAASDITARSNEAADTHLSRIIMAWSILRCSQVSFQLVNPVLFFDQCQLFLEILQLPRTPLMMSPNLQTSHVITSSELTEFCQQLQRCIMSVSYLPVIVNMIH